MSRPEHAAPPEIFYNVDEAAKYAMNSRMIYIQSVMAERALQLLNLKDENALILDIGCGSGLSGEVLSNKGLAWIGTDISSSMLSVAMQREVDGDVILGDMGEGLPFRPGVFDGAISISALQWLCNADFTDANPYKRCMKLFTRLYAALKRGTRAVFQWYPENTKQMEMVTAAAMKCGFTGGMIIDYPHSTRAKKYFLVLFCGASSDPSEEAPKALGTNGEEPDEGDAGAEGEGAPTSASVLGASRRRVSRRGKKVSVKSREWIQSKKDRQRRQGKEVRSDSKYTGRKRKGKF
eukprot:ANDGO_04604.mRNA.1 putative 18S rRNA (guanine-N(7))-methyltransferase